MVQQIGDLSLQGLPKIRTWLMGFFSRAEDMDLLLDPIVVKDIIDRFEKEETPEHAKWKPLTKRYKAWKKRMGYPDKLLVITGNLFAVASRPTRFKQPFSLSYRLTPAIFSIFHGTQLRRFWGLSKEARDKLTKAISQWVWFGKK